MADVVEYACAACGVRNRIPRSRLLDDPLCGSCKQKMFPRAPIPASDASFAEEVERSPIPALVDFWAPWCGPCRLIAPALEELARERAGRLKIVKVNVDESPAVGDRFAVRSIPTLKLFRDGMVVDEMVGALPKAQIVARVDRHLAPRSDRREASAP